MTGGVRMKAQSKSRNASYSTKAQSTANLHKLRKAFRKERRKMAETMPTPSPSEQGEQVNMNVDNDQKDSQQGAGASASSNSNANMALAATMAEDLQRTVMESTDSAVRSARYIQHHLPQYIGKAVDNYRIYEHAFFTKIKEGLTSAIENPAPTLGIGLTAAFLVLPGPRRFLFRQTFRRLQSEEAQFLSAEKSVKELNLSVDLMKKESKKLLERALLAEKDMTYGHNDLMDVGRQIQHLSKSVHKVESQASDLMDGLREIPNREALKLRAEVASMTSILKRQRSVLDKHIMKISELGLPV